MPHDTCGLNDRRQTDLILLEKEEKKIRSRIFAMAKNDHFIDKVKNVYASKQTPDNEMHVKKNYLSAS